MQLFVGLRRAALTGALTAGCVVIVAGTAQAQTVHGTVVHRISRAQSFVVASSSGRLFAVHSRRRTRIGSRVVVSLRRLRNGTFAANVLRVVGHTHTARLRGTITYVNRHSGSFTLSAHGVSMLVHAARGRVRAADALPPVGTNVTTTTTIDDQGDVSEQSMRDTGTQTGGFDIEGTVLSIDTTANTITISSDDDDQSGSGIVVTVPSTLSVSPFTVGEEVELNVAPQPDGSLLLQGSASDQGTQGAQDQSDQQGDQGDQNDQSDHNDQCAAQTPSGSAGSSGSTVSPDVVTASSDCSGSSSDSSGSSDSSAGSSSSTSGSPGSPDGSSGSSSAPAGSPGSTGSSSGQPGDD